MKFKRRKAIAQKKLEDEQANLVRVSDILSELEKQVGPLERQSKAAREYLQLKEDLKLCDANQFLMETEDIQKQLSEVEQKKQILAGDLDGSRVQEEKLKEEYDALENALAQEDARMTENRSALNQATVSKSGLEGQIGVLNEQIHTEELNEEHFNSRKTAITRDLEARKEQLAVYEDQKKEMDGQAAQVMERLDEAARTLEGQDELIRSLEQEIEAQKSGIINALNERATLTARQQRYETMMEQVNLRRSEVTQKLLKYKSDESVQDEQIKSEEAALAQVEAALEENQSAAQQTEEELNQADQELRRLNRNLNDTQQQYHMAYTKLESLRNLAERYDGYGNSIRRVMEVRDRVHGIHGVVADLITAPQKYEIAIETALGGSIQNIVTASEETAKQLIEYLKKNKYGRATFLPLTSLSSKQGFNQESALKEPGVLGLASQLVQADPQYDGLVRYLLGRVVVTDTIDHAIALARKYKYSLRIVTLEGELLSAGGSMTGGAFKNTSNLLGRRREIEELEETCKKALVQVEKIQGDLNLQEGLLQEKKEEQDRLRSGIQSLYLRQNTLRLNITQLEEKKAEIAGSSVDLVREHGQLEEQVREITGSQESLKLDVAGLEERNSQAGRIAQEKGVILEEAKTARDGYASGLAQVQLEAAGLKQKQDFLQENVSRVRGERAKLESEYRELVEGAGNSQEIIGGKRRQIQELTRQIAAVTQQMQELETLIAGQMEKKDQMSGQQKGFFARREELASRISALDKDMFRLQTQEEKLEERLEHATTYMWNEYEMTFSTAQELRRPEYDSLTDLKHRIDDLKSRIKALGSVNVNAIEDYREVSERYEFMSTQHGDLVAAQAELEKIIDELDAGMRRQFEEKFGEIKAEFDKVFRELFGGGRGTLELMADEDILEAGIQIIAQPPGKKLQNMMQLSGGEKALTAISLLFAIQNLKPSPFCLLDEIEAALDDSNVDRFAGYLSKLIKNTQFIVITHRRGTMVAADRLYGITMQEKGVSTLVSVNLIEEDLDK